jgi:hypothetical protein
MPRVQELLNVGDIAESEHCCENVPGLDGPA